MQSADVNTCPLCIAHVPHVDIQPKIIFFRQSGCIAWRLRPELIMRDRMGLFVFPLLSMELRSSHGNGFGSRFHLSIFRITVAFSLLIRFLWLLGLSHLFIVFVLIVITVG